MKPEKILASDPDGIRSTAPAGHRSCRAPAAAPDSPATPPAWSLRTVTPQDTEWLVSLKEATMRPDLERLGVWAPQRSRHRLLQELAPATTWKIIATDQPVGSIGLRPGESEDWLQHFYLLPEHQGRGLGSAVLRHVLDRRNDPRPLRLSAVRGSRALTLYQRHGFVQERDHENGIDLVLVRAAPSA